MVKLLILFFSFLLISCSVLVVVVKNPLHSVLFLVVCFLASSIILFLLGNEFLALFFLIIYLGAVAILFLFVVMMLDIKYTELQTSFLYFPVGIFIGFTILFETLSSFTEIFSFDTDFSLLNHNSYVNWYNNLDPYYDFQVLGQNFYHHYTLQILIGGLILYLATVGVAFLTIKPSSNKKKRKDQSLLKQLSRKNSL
jgi:NADH-quinone oxidoreductase subunit J